MNMGKVNLEAGLFFHHEFVPFRNHYIFGGHHPFRVGTSRFESSVRLTVPSASWRAHSACFVKIGARKLELCGAV